MDDAEVGLIVGKRYRPRELEALGAQRQYELLTDGLAVYMLGEQRFLIDKRTWSPSGPLRV